jgi:hypothetical protein
MNENGKHLLTADRYISLITQVINLMNEDNKNVQDQDYEKTHFTEKLVQNIKIESNQV